MPTGPGEWDPYSLTLAEIRTELADCSEAIKRDPGDADAYHRRGSLYLMFKQYPRAIEDFSEEMALRTVSHEVYRNRGIAYAALGDHENAVQDFSQVIRLKPFDAMAYHHRGDAFLGLGKLRQAIGDYTQAMGLGLRSDEVHRGRGSAYAGMGEFAEAIEDYDRAIELSPYCASFISPSKSYAFVVNVDGCAALFFHRGAAHRKLGDYGRAIEDLESAIAICPEKHVAYTDLAWLLATCPDPTFRNGTRAIEVARKAKTLEANPKTIATLAAAYAAAGIYREAAETQEEAIALAKQEDKTGLLPLFVKHLESYRSGTPLRDP